MAFLFGRFHPATQTYLPYDKEWLKKQIHQHLLKIAGLG